MRDPDIESIQVAAAGIRSCVGAIVMVPCTVVPALYATISRLPWWGCTLAGIAAFAVVFTAMAFNKYFGALVNAALWVYAYTIVIRWPVGVWSVLFYVLAAGFVLSMIIPALSEYITTKRARKAYDEAFRDSGSDDELP